jgi:hypothetical protein
VGVGEGPEWREELLGRFDLGEVGRLWKQDEAGPRRLTRPPGQPSARRLHVRSRVLSENSALGLDELDRMPVGIESEQGAKSPIQVEIGSGDLAAPVLQVVLKGNDARGQQAFADSLKRVDLQGEVGKTIRGRLLERKIWTLEQMNRATFGTQEPVRLRGMRCEPHQVDVEPPCCRNVACYDCDVVQPAGSASSNVAVSYDALQSVAGAVLSSHRVAARCPG